MPPRKKSYNLIQNGTIMSGVNMSLPNINDEEGILNGTVSPDVMTDSGTWIEKGEFFFVLSEDGSSINATITKSLNLLGPVCFKPSRSNYSLYSEITPLRASHVPAAII